MTKMSAAVATVLTMFVFAFTLFVAYGFARELMDKHGISISSRTKTLLKILAVPCFLIFAWYKFSYAQKFRHQAQEDPSIVDFSEIWIIWPISAFAFVVFLYLFKKISRARGWKW